MVGATAMNADSSRSHSIFTLIIECIEKFDGKGDGDSHIRVGKVGGTRGGARQDRVEQAGGAGKGEACSTRG